MLSFCLLPNCFYVSLGLDPNKVCTSPPLGMPPEPRLVPGFLFCLCLQFIYWEKRVCLVVSGCLDLLIAALWCSSAGPSVSSAPPVNGQLGTGRGQRQVCAVVFALVGLYH